MEKDGVILRRIAEDQELARKIEEEELNKYPTQAQRLQGEFRRQAERQSRIFGVDLGTIEKEIRTNSTMRSLGNLTWSLQRVLTVNRKFEHPSLPKDDIIRNLKRELKTLLTQIAVVCTILGITEEDIFNQ